MVTPPNRALPSLHITPLHSGKSGRGHVMAHRVRTRCGITILRLFYRQVTTSGPAYPPDLQCSAVSNASCLPKTFSDNGQAPSASLLKRARRFQSSTRTCHPHLSLSREDAYLCSLVLADTASSGASSKCLGREGTWSRYEAYQHQHDAAYAQLVRSLCDTKPYSHAPQ